MRVAVSFGTLDPALFHQQFIPASKMSAIVIKPGVKGIEAILASLVPTTSGVEIGAVGYPYTGEDIRSGLAHKQVRAVRTASATFKYVFNKEGKVVGVRSKPSDHRVFVDAEGNEYSAADIRRRWFSGADLDEVRAQESANGSFDETKFPKDYVSWMKSVANNKRVIDTSNTTGSAMARVIDEVFFGDVPISNVIKLPELYVVSSAPVEFRPEFGREFLLDYVRGNETLDAEFAPFNCTVINEIQEDGRVYLDLQRMKKIHTPNGVVFSADDPDSPITIDFPLTPQFSREYQIQAALTQGTEVLRDSVVLRGHRLVSLINTNPTCPDYEAAVRALGGSDASETIVRRAVEQNRPQIGNVKATSFKLIKALPENLDPRSIYVRNVTSHMVVNTEGMSMLIGQCMDGLIRWNLGNHPWDGQGRTRQEKTSGIGDMIQEAAAAAA